MRVDKFTRAFTDSAPGLEKFAVGEVKYGSVANSQTNQFLCCVIDEVESDIDGLAIDGRIRRNPLEQADGNLAEATSKGLRWNVYKHPVEIAFPSFPSHIQSVKNMIGQLQRDDSM